MSDWSKVTNAELADRITSIADMPDLGEVPVLREAASRLRAMPDVCREFVSDERSPLHCRKCGMQAKYGEHR